MVGEKYVIIVAGGTGTRMKTDLPKQFIHIKGKPVVIHTIQKFLEYDSSLKLIIVSHKDYQNMVIQLLEKHFPGKRIQTTIGGKTRFDSVKNGLNKIEANDGIVAIHDAARPLVSLKTISNCFDTAASKGNAIPVVPVNESLRYTDEKGNRSADRKLYKIVQTPQCFKISSIKKAFEQAYSEKFTDDASVLENVEETIFLTEGNPENIKITTLFDLKIAEAFLV
jgi:2-C-methyl-D-erythritol 4-phosphate cytidylyltransferase